MIGIISPQYVCPSIETKLVGDERPDKTHRRLTNTHVYVLITNPKLRHSPFFGTQVKISAAENRHLYIFNLLTSSGVLEKMRFLGSGKAGACVNFMLTALICRRGKVRELGVRGRGEKF